MATNARLYQEYVEVLATGTSSARNFQQYVEALTSGPGAGRLFQQYIEALAVANTAARLYQEYVELLHTPIVVLTGDASNTITFTQATHLTFDRSVSNTITFGHNALLDVQPTSNTLSLSESVSETHSRGRSRTSTLTVSQLLSYNRVFNRAVTSSLSLTQKANLQRYAANTINLIQSVLGVNTKGANNTITFGQSVTEEHYKYRKVFDNLNLTQSVLREVIYDRTLTNSTNFSQVLQRCFTPTAQNTLALTHVVAATVSKYITQSITFSQSVSRQLLKLKSASNTIPLHQTVAIKKFVNMVTNNVINFRYRGRVLPIRNRSVDNTLAFTQQAFRTRIEDDENNTLALTQEVAAQKLMSRSATANLNLSQTLTTANVIRRSVTHTLTFPANRILPVRIGDIDEVVIPPTSGTVLHGDPGGQSPYYEAGADCTDRPFRPDPKKNFVVLSVGARAVVLPAPLFGDRLGNTDQFTLSMSMTGEAYTTIKKSKTLTFSYEWDLSYLKAEELAEFVWEHNAKAIKIENWKGEIWVVRITSNPIEFRDQLLPVQCPGSNQSKFFVALDFEGVRIH